MQNSQAAQLAVRMNFTTAQQAGGQGALYELLKQKLSVNATPAPEPYGYVASDALWIIAKAYAENNTQNSTALREAIPRIASSYEGLTGNTTLNAVGDRKYANYDFGRQIIKTVPTSGCSRRSTELTQLLGLQPCRR
ncbi:MAG TPA: hypothetical protein VF393_00650 [archaeon]